MAMEAALALCDDDAIGLKDSVSAEMAGRNSEKRS